MPETRTAHIVLNANGLVVARIKQGARQTLEDAKANLATCVSETGGRRRPLLVDISGSQPLESDVRHHYSGETLVDSFSALAMIIAASPLSRMMANVYLRVARPGIPTQLFAEEARAVEWLTQYRS
jgi:hypothetical protein